MVNFWRLSVLILLIVGTYRSEEVREELHENCKNGICEDNPPENPEFYGYQCMDLRDDCSSKLDLCNVLYTQVHCPKSCKVCHLQTRAVNASLSTFPAPLGPPQNFVVRDVVGHEMGVPQHLSDRSQVDLIRRELYLLRQTKRYMREEVAVQDKYRWVRDTCRNQHPRCIQWAAQGLCTDNSKFKKLPVNLALDCAPACRTCEQLQPYCPVDEQAPRAWSTTTSLHNTFTRILEDESLKHLNPRAVSHPQSTQLDDRPWIVVLDDFNPVEAYNLIAWGNAHGFGEAAHALSRDMDEEAFISTTCFGHCLIDFQVNESLLRLDKVTGLPRDNSEGLQLMVFDEGESLSQRHDFKVMEREQKQGPVILTVFIFLKDVLAGGELYFRELGLIIPPKRGRAVIWPSGRASDPLVPDERLVYQHWPVTDGPVRGYGAKIRYHLWDYTEAAKDGCRVP